MSSSFTNVYESNLWTISWLHYSYNYITFIEITKHVYKHHEYTWTHLESVQSCMNNEKLKSIHLTTVYPHHIIINYVMRNSWIYERIATLFSTFWTLFKCPILSHFPLIFDLKHLLIFVKRGVVKRLSKINYNTKNALKFSYIYRINWLLGV